jgi:hypothetical protein
MSKTKKELTWQDVYDLPLEPFYKGSSKIMTSTFKMALDFIPSYINIESSQISVEDMDKIIRIINGSEEKIITPKVFTYKNGTISVDGLVMAWIRGWGYLTGVGALNLPEYQAIKIQNDFAEYILTRLKNACT